MAAGIGAISMRSLGSSQPEHLRADSSDARIEPYDLRCESLSSPLGIDADRPRLSWKLRALTAEKGLFQTAYRIRAASSSQLLMAGQPNLWDSGKVDSNQQLHVEFGGPPLSSGDRCYWSVEVWDSTDGSSTTSAPAWFECGLLEPDDWSANWISDGRPLPQSDEGFYEDDPAPLFRKQFIVDKPIKQARLYSTGLGYGEFKVNGEISSDSVLDPAWTSTDKRIFYSCHDVTKMLNRGENIIGAHLGNGWHNPLPLRMWGRINIREHLPVARPMFIAQLVIEYADGTSQIVNSDESWKTAPGPILQNSVYRGEIYDARRDQESWERPGFDDSAWTQAELASPPEGELRALPMPPIRATQTLRPVSVTEVSEGRFIYDFGQNFAGWAGLSANGPSGTEIKMRLGELIYEEGTLNPLTAVAGQIKSAGVGGPGSPDVAWQENTFILKGEGDEFYRPRFTFHGFRYVEVTGYPGTPDLNSIFGYRLNTDVEKVGSFRCSNDLFNEIQEVVDWTLLSNLFSVQSDCPAREKFGYGGDIVAASEMAILNFDMSSFYAKTVDDFRDAVRGDGWFPETAPYVGISAANYEPEAGPIGWGLAHPLLVAQLYQYYGDRRIVEENFEAAATWVDLLEKHSDGLIIDRCIGDHESLDPKPTPLIATAQFWQAATLVSGFAETIGKADSAARYQELADRIKAAFLEKFLDHETGRFGSATQAAQATAIDLGLAPESVSSAAAKRMVAAVEVDHKGHIAAGIFGTKYLLNALTKSGNADTAYKMVDQRSYPGWGHMLENGATTLWETWRQSDNVFSQNHPMFGSVSEWFFKCLGGIRPADNAVGFDKFLIAPGVVSGLDWVETNYESARGMVSSRWRVSGGELEMILEVPVNTEAAVQVPTSEPDSIRVNGASVDSDKPLVLGSGTHTVVAQAAV
jgi:alpha-L-rhamnosidase